MSTSADDIDRYLDDALEGTAKTQFENRMIEDPELATAVLRRRHVRTELRKGIAVSQVSPQGSGPVEEAPREAVVRQLFPPRRSLHAGSVAVGAAAAMLVLGFGSLLRDVEEPAARGLVAELYLESTRGTSQGTVAAGAPFLLTIAPADASNEYTITLLDADGETHFALERTTPTSAGLVLAALEPLEPGRYTIELRSSEGSERIAFDVR